MIKFLEIWIIFNINIRLDKKRDEEDSNEREKKYDSRTTSSDRSDVFRSSNEDSSETHTLLLKKRGT